VDKGMGTAASCMNHSTRLRVDVSHEAHHHLVVVTIFLLRIKIQITHPKIALHLPRTIRTMVLFSVYTDAGMDAIVLITKRT
jgi:hypothetical protein